MSNSKDVGQKPITDAQYKSAADYALRDAELCEKHGNHSGAETYRLEAQDYLLQIDKPAELA